MYVVSTAVRTTVDDAPETGGILVLGKPRGFPDLATATEYANLRIASLSNPGTIIEVRESTRDGQMRYRVERKANGRLERFGTS